MVKLLSGSRGMLGVMSEVSLKVMPIPETSQTLRIATVSDDMAVQAMSRALGSPYDVSGAAHIPGFGTVLRLEGFADSVAYRAAQLQDKLSDFGTVDLIEFDWTRVRDVQDLADWDGDIWRVHVKPSDGPGLVAATGGNAIYDWGGGLVWLGTMAGTDIRPHLAGLDGHATLFCTRDPGGIPIFHPENPVVQKITDGLKDRFDPRGLFNPRK
jgi:glycolate oxidase FAD binding subunit